MIINNLPTTGQRALQTVKFDGRFTTPVRLGKKLSQADGSITGFIDVFLDKDSVAGNENVASIAIAVATQLGSATANVATLPVGAPSRRSFGNAIQTMTAQTFNSASIRAAANIINVRLSMTVLQARMAEAFAQYVLPVSDSSLIMDKQAFFEDVFVSRTDPGSVSGYELVGAPVAGTSMVEISEAGIANFDSLPEWMIVTITSYDGKGVYIGSNSIRANTRALAAEYDLTQIRLTPQPLINANKGTNGNVAATVQSTSTAKLYVVNIDPGSLLQDTGQTTAEFVGMAAPDGIRTETLSPHLAESDANSAIYRAVDPIGRFTGAVVGGELNASCFQASVSLSRVPGGILVEVLNVPANVSFVRVYRRSSSIDQTPTDGPDVLVFSQPSTGSPVDMSMTDTLDQAISTVARPMSYTYYVECVDNKGNVTTTRSSAILIEPSSVALGFAKPLVEGLAPAYNPQLSRFSLSFQLSFQVAQDTVTTELVKVLAAQGLIQYYSDQIDPNKLAEMMTAKVTLRNMITGDEIYLGTYGQGASVIATGLTPSYYKLELITTIRKAETSIDTYVATGRSTPRPGSGAITTYQYLPAVSVNPAGVLNGTLTPSGSAQPNTVYQTYTGNSALVGYFVDATYVAVDLLTSTKPSIVQKQTAAVAVSPLLEKISWQVDKTDSANSISHFLIVRDGKLRGVQAGSASNNTSYVFYDTPVSVAGNGKYKLVGYLFDGTVMAGSDT